MRRTSSVFAAILSMGLVGFGTGCGKDNGNLPPGQTAPPETPLVSGLTVSEVAFFQTLKGSIMKDGQPGVSAVPIVAGKPGVLRVYLTPQAGWSQHEILARLELSQGATVLPAIEKKQTIASASTDGNLSSTINFDLPAETVTTELTWSITLYEVDDAKASAGDKSGARYPATGEASFGAVPTDKIRVVLLPVVYEADGSNRTPETDAETIERYRARMLRLYPASDVEVTVGEPFSWPNAIRADGRGWGGLLNAIVEQRINDGVPANVYYYGLFNPSSSFNSYCQVGCVLGLSPLGYDPSDDYARASIGIGFANFDAGSDGTFVHEVGHAHGREHAPCQTDDADPAFPYSDGEIGVWGYDSVRQRMVDPNGSTRDMMGYCDPIFISDYTYTALHERVMALAVAPYRLEVPTRWRSIVIGEDGEATRGGVVTAKRSPQGKDKVVSRTLNGKTESLNARFYPFDHLPGGILLVPESDDAGTLRIDGKLVR